MFFLILPLLFLNLHIGFLIFEAGNRTKSAQIYFKKKVFFFFLSSGFILLSISYFSAEFSACIPLLLGFFCFLRFKFKNHTSEIEELNSINVFLEMLLIYLKTGRSFSESLTLSQVKMAAKTPFYFEIKKNVVMQQPKSRNSRLFSELKNDLQVVLEVHVGKRELLESTKTKFETFLTLKQKTKTATTQYRAQSITLLIFWCSSFLSLIWQNKALLHLKPISISLLLMLAGFLLSKKILVKTSFRI